MDDLLSWPPTPVLSILEVCCATYDTWKYRYATDINFQEIWEALQIPTVINQTPFLDYTIWDEWLYNLNFLRVPHSRTPLSHHGSTFFSLWGPLQNHKDHPTSATPFSLAFHATSSWKIYQSLCLMLTIQAIQPEEWVVSTTIASFSALGVNLNGLPKWTSNNPKEAWWNLSSGMPI